MANKIHELISSSINYTVSTDNAGALRYAPASPMVFVYLDRRSLRFQSALCKKMNECWGYRTEAFFHIFLSDDVMYQQDSNGEWTVETDQYDIVERVLDIEDVQLNSSGEIKLFFILNTCEVTSPEHFRQLFSSVSRFKDIDAVDFLTNFVLIETLAIKPADSARKEAIRRFLCSPEAQKVYNAVFLLSNQLPKGVLRGEKEAHNYELLGNIAVIINNDDNEKANRRNVLYNLAGGSVAITGSMLKYQKPVWAISITSYLTIMDYIMQTLFDVKPDYRIPEKDIKNALELVPGTGFQFLVNKLNVLLEDAFPKVEDLRCLPNINPEVISIRGKAGEILDRDSVFSQLDSLTMNAWTPFYEANFRSNAERCLTDDFKESIRTKVIQLLTDRFSYAQLTMLMESDAQAIIDSGFPKAMRSKPIENYSELYKYVREVALEDIYRELRDVFVDAVKQLDHRAEEYALQLRNMRISLGNMSQDNLENVDISSIESFYGGIIRMYLMKSDVTQRVRETFRKIYDDEDTICSLLETLYKNMVENCPQFKLKFEDELGMRISSGQTGADNIIAQSLNTGDDEVISLKSPIKPQLIHGYYLARKEADYVKLVSGFEDSIVDTNSVSSAEHIRLYRCGSEHLIIE